MDLHKFRSVKLKRPTAFVDCPELKGVLFAEDEQAPRLKVRGLTANELFVAREAKDNNSITAAFQQALKSGNTGELTTVFKRVIGDGGSDATAAELAFRVEIVRLGTLDDAGKRLFEHSDAVKLSEHFPLTFQNVSTQILSLSGEGSDVGEK